MSPTNRLRFVERRYPDATIRVLQQWWGWEKEPDWPGEWRDIPLEEEK